MMCLVISSRFSTNATTDEKTGRPRRRFPAGSFFALKLHLRQTLPWRGCRFLLWVVCWLSQMILWPVFAGKKKGVIGLYESSQYVKKRGGAVLAAMLLAVFLCAGTTVEAAVVTERMLVPVGHTVGIKLFSQGVLVVKLPEGDTPAKECGLQTGDVIVRCGGITVDSTEQFQALLQKQGQAETDLQIRRGGRNMTLSVSPEPNEQGDYAIGAWIRDSMAGIGTVTYYDPATGDFGALGHGVTDVDTALLMPFSSGSVLPSTVKAVKKGAAGNAGELRGDFDLKSTLGDLYANTSCGVFGTAEQCPENWQEEKALPVAAVEDVHAGPAVILSNVRGDEVKRYDIEILKVIPDAADGRNLVLSVTDPDLIAATGGIVQGMSGSPIIQDGKLVGAVTHVLVNDPTRGYGIFIENMLEAAE